MADQIYRNFFPYCLQRLKSGEWLLLNRNYKPLGEQKDDWVEYETHPSKFKFDRFTSAAAQKLSINPLKGAIPDLIWFYDDGTAPTKDADSMRSYLARLEVLAKLKTKHA